VRAAESIRHVDPAAYVREAVAYVAAHPGHRFRLSAQVSKLAADQRLSLPGNAVAGDNTAADRVVLFARAEGPNPFKWQANDPWLADAVFGPREVSFFWYSSWSGHDRVVVMTADKARATGVPFVH
jgi:hypothetical protein